MTNATLADIPTRHVIFYLRHFGAYALADELVAQKTLAPIERKKALEFLVSCHRPKQRPRTFDKRLIKVILSLKQGYDGDKANCFYCKDLCTIENLTVHHVNYIESDNRLTNLEVAQGACNTKHYSVVMWQKKTLAAGGALVDRKERERAPAATPQAPAS